MGNLKFVSLAHSILRATIERDFLSLPQQNGSRDDRARRRLGRAVALERSEERQQPCYHQEQKQS